MKFSIIALRNLKLPGGKLKFSPHSVSWIKSEIWSHSHTAKKWGMPNESLASGIFRFIKFNWSLVPIAFLSSFPEQKCSLALALGRFCRWSQRKVKLKDLITSKALSWLYVLMRGSLSLSHKLIIRISDWKLSMGLSMGKSTVDCFSGVSSPALVKTSYWTIMK